jgi:succinoglycan biosynthesis transport protein ExoP
MTLRQFLDILRARWRLAAAVLALCLATALALSWLLPKRYTAAAQVLVDMKGTDPVLGVLAPAQIVPGHMATQVDIVSSQRVALKVVDQLRIAENSRAVAQWREEADGLGSIRHFYADLLLKNLDVKPARESSLLNIAYTGADPQFASLVANSFAQAYVDLNLELRVEPARRSRGFFDEQTQSLRDKLEAAQARLSAYQREKGITSTDERWDVENARLAELSTQLTLLQSQSVEAAKRHQVAREAMATGNVAEVPEVLGNMLIQTLKADQARIDAKIEQQSAVLGASHPDILKMRDEVAAIRARLGKEMSTVVSSLSKTAQVQAQRESELRASLERQRSRVLQIKQTRDELTVLQREVESAQKSFDVVSQRLTQTSLESQVNQASVVLLNPASEPAKPSSPKLALNVAVGGFLGTLLAVGAVLVAELRNRRVRGPQDLLLATGLAPMGALRDAFGGRRSWARGRRRRPSLAHGRAPRLQSAASDPPSRMFPDTIIAAQAALDERAGRAAGVPSAGGRTATQPAFAEGPNRQPIGQILVRAGLIHAPEVDRILEWAREEGRRFGETAVAHKLITEEQIERALALQFDYPVLIPGETQVSGEVVAAYDARNPLVADLRRLRAKIRNLQVTSPTGSPIKAVAVISSGSGEGKSFLASNLAVTFSQMGQRTLLIDADLRRGRLHRLFGLSNQTGLSTMLNGRIGPGSLQKVPGLRSLTVLTAGPLAPNPSELLSRDAFGLILDAFCSTYDIVILDTPGAADEPDATVIAQRAGAALVLARRNRSSFDAVVELVNAGAGPKVAVLGSVLNEA